MRDKIQAVIKLSFYLFMGLAAAFYIIVCRMDKDSVTDIPNPVYIENWTVIDSFGNRTEVGRTYVDDRAFTEDFTIVGRLPEGINDNSVLCFATRSNTMVYIDGQLRRSFNRSRDVAVPGGSVKSFYMIVPLKAADSGAEIRMFRGRTDRHPEIVPLTFVAPLSGVYSFLLGEYGLAFMLGFMIMVLSAIVALAGASMRIIYKRHIDMLYAALGIFITSGWIVSNSYIYPFLMGHYHIDGTMNYFCSLLMPMGFLFYLDSLQKRRYTVCMTTMMVINTINDIVWVILHFAHIFSFPKALVYMDLELVVIMLAVFITIIVDIKKGYFREYKYTAIGFIGFVFMGFGEVVVLLLIETKNDDVPMITGLAFLLLCVVIQQVHDLRKVNEEKQRAMELSDAKTRFLAGMSHEIRTPINSILGMNEMILRENKDKTIDKYARSVRSSGKMLLTLVNDVLDFSKIEAGKLEITMADYSLTRLLKEIMPLITERISAKELDYETIIEDGVPDGQNGDEFRIKQVLINLLSNAIKYTDEGSVKLTVGGEYASEDSYILKFTVKDTGRGIKEEDRVGLFDAFARVDMSKNRNIEGTGLGLSIVKNIIEAMGGSIDLVSEYGIGSEFIVKVPVTVTDTRPVAKDLSGAEVEQEDTPACDYLAPDAKVLVVDDNKANLTIAELFLGFAGIKPELAINGKEAIEKCRTTKYDLLLLDHMMPAPDGMETFKIIKEDTSSLNNATPAVILTANAIAGSREIYMNAGFADYLTKPIDSVLLLQTVKRFIPANKIHDDKIADKAKTADEVKTQTLSEVTDSTGNDQADEFLGGLIDNGSVNLDSELIRKLSSIEGLDVKTALRYAGNSEKLLQGIVDAIADEGETKAARMREALAAYDYAAYRTEAHSVKGNMATLGVESLRERAKKHEYAARDGEVVFIADDSEDFIREYEELCRKLK